MKKNRPFARCLACLLAIIMSVASLTAVAEDETFDGEARQEFIDRIINLAEEKYNQARGRPQRAASSGDIYVCKNFTVYLFRENRDAFRMA